MKIIAYSYSDPLLEPPLNPMVWGWELDCIYQDLGERQQLKQLLIDCREAPVDYLLIRRWEELGNSIGDINSFLKELDSLNIQIIAVESVRHRGDFLALLDDINYDKRSRRICQGHARNRLKAKPPPGKAPYGYKRSQNNYRLDRSCAPVVKAFFEQFLLYGSLRGAVRFLEKRYGKKISVSTGRRWLTNVVYRGDTAFKNGDILSNTHVPIISREEAAQVDRLLQRNYHLSPRTASAPRSLAGLVVCGKCDSRMTITKVTRYRKAENYLYLRPLNCPLMPKCGSLSYDRILQETITAICRDFPGAIAGLELPRVEEVKGEIEGAIARNLDILDRLPELIETRILDRETAELRAYKLRTEIAELEGRLSQLPPVNLQSIAEAVSIPQFWLDLSESERRFYFREFLRQIEVIRQGKTDWKLQLRFIF